VSNVEGRNYFEKVTEWSVPLRDGKCTARDMSDLMRMASKQAVEIDPKHADYDDAYYLEWDEDRVKVVFRREWKDGAPT